MEWKQNTMQKQNTMADFQTKKQQSIKDYDKCHTSLLIHILKEVGKTILTLPFLADTL